MTDKTTKAGSMPQNKTSVTLAPNQRWTPAPGKRAKAREIMCFETDGDGYPGVRYAQFWTNCGWTQPSTIRVEGFRAWIRKMKATCEVVGDEQS